MIDAIGVDIVETARIRRLLEAHGDRLLDRLLGPDERAIFERRVDGALFLAGRFAAKEALVKALGRFISDRPPFSHMQIINDPTGLPEVRFSKEIAASLSGLIVQVSLSHEKQYAVGMAFITETK